MVGRVPLPGSGASHATRHALRRRGREAAAMEMGRDGRDGDGEGGGGEGGSRGGAAVEKGARHFGSGRWMRR